MHKKTEERNFISRKREASLCGPRATCNCSTTERQDVISVDDCQAAKNGVFLISNIIFERIAIGAMYHHHIENLTTIGLIFSENQIKEIVDFNRSVIRWNSISTLEFENNPNLILGVTDVFSRIGDVDCTIFKQYGVSKLHDVVFSSTNVTFSNFSTTFYNFYSGSPEYEDHPWSSFVVDNIDLEGKFFDFSNFSGSTMKVLTIRNVISISGVELVPENFLSQCMSLKKLFIYNTYCVTLPKYFFQNLNNSVFVFSHLTLELDIWNIQQHTLAPRLNLTRLEKLNHVKITDEMRDVLASLNDTSKCTIFCQSFNGTQFKCSELSANEKRACGICVKNIKGDTRLTKELEDVCDITNKQISSKVTSTSDNEASTGMPWTTTTGKINHTLQKNIHQHTDKKDHSVFFFQFTCQMSQIRTQIVQMSATK